MAGKGNDFKLERKPVKDDARRWSSIDARTNSNQFHSNRCSPINQHPLSTNVWSVHKEVETFLLFFSFSFLLFFFFHRRKFPRSSHICPAARRVREHDLIKGQTAEDQLQRVSFYVFSLFARFDKKDRPLLRPETRPQS